MKKFNIKSYFFVFLIFFLEISSIWWLQSDLNKKISIRSDELQTTLDNAYNSSLASYYKWATFVFNNDIKNNKEALSYFYQGFSNQGNERDTARNNLYNCLLPLYEDLQKNNFSQLHFHFSDGTSFLRFHKPQNFGDNLFKTRYSVEKANREKITVKGFETGRIFHGFRFVFPVFYSQTHAGSVEVNVSFNAIKDSLEILNPGEYDFIVKKEMVVKTIFQENMKYYSESYFNKNFLIKNDENILNKSHTIGNKHNIHSETRNEIIKKLKNEINLNLEKNNDFTLFTKFKGNFYSYTFKTVSNIKNQKIAYFSFLKLDHIIHDYYNFFYINVIFISIINIFLIIYFFILENKNQKNLKQKKDLEETKQKLLNITENIPDGLFLLDFSGMIISINNTAKKIFQTDESFFLNNNILDLFYCLKSIHNIKQEYFSDKDHYLYNSSFECTKEINLKNIYFSLRFIYLKNEIQRNQTLVIISDITEHKLNLEKINLFSQLVEQTPLSIVITDTNANIEYINPIFTNITGYSQEEVMGKNPRILQAGDLSKEFYNNLWQTIASGETWTGEFHNRKKNNELFWELAIIFPIKNNINQITHYAAIKEDISEKKQINEALEKTRGQLDFILDNLAMGVAITKNRIIYEVNKTVIDIFGYDSSDEVIGKSTEIIYPSQEHHLDFGKKSFEALSKGKVFISEQYLKKKNNELFWVKLFGKIIDPLNEEKGVMWLFEDISEQKKIQEELFISKMIAEKANRAKSEFLANMSHEIRTPMNAIMGMTELALEKSSDTEQTKHLKTVLDSSEYLLTVINEILDFSKIEAGKYDLEIKSFSLKELIEKIITALSVKAVQKNLKLSLNIEPEPKNYLFGDSHNLTKVFMNIIGNAIKFTKSGEINVDCKVINGKNNDMEIIFCVKDTGMGIPEDKLHNIFDAFSQADPSVTKKFGGTGLGLTITKKLVELMNGKVTVESKVGKGSTFCIFITLKKGELLYKTSNNYENGNYLIKSDPRIPLYNLDTKILIAEDNKTNQELLNIILKNLGFKTDLADNGIDALRMLAINSYDIIFMDIQMPYMDGLTAISIIRTFENGKKSYHKDISDIQIKLSEKLKGRHTNIVIITAHAIQGYKEECLKKGGDDFITKPISKKELVRILEKFLETDVKKYISDNNIEKNNKIYQQQVITDHLKNSYDLSTEQIDLILKNFSATLLDLLTDLKSQILENDIENITKTAHSIKGSLLNLGLNDIAGIAKNIETNAKIKNNSIDYLKLCNNLQEKLNFIFEK